MRANLNLLGEENLDFKEKFAAFFSENFSRVFAFFKMRISNRDDCMDLTQETFIRAYRACKKKPDVELTFMWLFVIANNVLKNWFRYHQAKKRKASILPIDELNDSDRIIQRISGNGNQAQEELIKREKMG